MCHGDAAGAVFWQPRVECPTLTARVRSELNVTEHFAMENLQRNAQGEWGVPLGEGARETFHVCEIDPFFGETVEFFVRRCRVSVDTCAANWTGDQEVAALCAAYNAYVYDFDNSVYRNPHCALCNHVPAEQQFCVRRPMFRASFGNTFNTRSFSILLDIGDRSGSEDVGAVSVCSSNQLWDPFFRKCRGVVCDAAGYQLQDGACVRDEASTGAGAATNGSDFTRQITNDTTATSFLLCPKYYLNASEYEVAENDTIYVPLYDRTYRAGEYELREGELVVCAVSSDLSKFDLVLSYISLVCLAASVLCLALHLVAFCLVAEIRNLSGRNLASLSVCLLVGYLCFLALATQEPGSAGCTALAVVMFAAFVASFFWMNVMAFDVFTTLRKATTELRVRSGQHMRRYVLYSLYVWAMTTAVVVAAVLAENSAAIPDAYRPGFGDRVCWFSRRKALMAFFAAPLAAVMGVNVVMFVASAHMIRSTTKSTAHMTCGPSQVNLRLYSRLAVIMGLSWVVGLAAGWLDFPPLWYVFVVLNTLQGVFIFCSFTMADKVRDRVRRRASSWVSAPSSRGLASDSHVNTDSSGLSVTKTRL
ncbi:G-protein coupled receptor Mth2-like [Pollicipes pollicipes]|uniref:G-protein coupled receptor Mth2-like n=1 Tax=Pollicipes pollicipes TaxID=41117 RepID=UPI001885654A|nr:G-protein coupled receptor Mth2-like [Pollicipes pollicipes]